MKNIIIIVILILLFITSNTFAIPTLFSNENNDIRKHNLYGNEQSFKGLLNIDYIQFESKYLCNYKTVKINNVDCMNKNIQGLVRIPEPNTIILGGIGTLIVVWMRRARLL